MAYRRFQFSIGDAKQIAESDAAVVLETHSVSILYWRCGRAVGPGDASFVKNVSILYLRCPHEPFGIVGNELFVFQFSI